MNVKDLMKSITFNDIKDVILANPIQDIDNYKKTFDELCSVKPSFGYFDMTIEVKRNKEGKISVSNTHLGALSDLAGRRVKIDSKSNLSDAEVAGNIIFQITAHSYDTERYKDNLSDWDEDMMNPQKSRIVR
nr:hypothetical protein [Prevotella sp.]